MDYICTFYFSRISRVFFLAMNAAKMGNICQKYILFTTLSESFCCRILARNFVQTAKVIVMN